MRKGSIVALLGIGVVAGGVATAIALVPTWLPVRASREADRIHFVTWFVIVICIVIFSIVAAVMIYAVSVSASPRTTRRTGRRSTATPGSRSPGRRFLRPRHRDRDRERHRPLPQRRAAENTLRVNVLAQQFEFTFSYPDAHNATSPVLRLPEGRSVELYMRSLDVIHSVFVPQFSQKEDIVPGLVTQLHITPTRVGTFPLECTELCGLGHSLMRSEAIVMKPAAFNAWLKQQKTASTKG